MKSPTVLMLAIVITCVLPFATGAAGKGKKAADPDAPPAGVRWAIEPNELDFGEVPGGESKALGIKVFNQGDKEGSTRCGASGPGAKYVAVDKTGPLMIPAVGAIEVRVTLDAKSALIKKGAKVKKDKELKDIPVKATVTCGGKRADVKAVIKPRTEEEKQKDEPPPPPKADEIPGL